LPEEGSTARTDPPSVPTAAIPPSTTAPVRETPGSGTRHATFRVSASIATSRGSPGDAGVVVRHAVETADAEAAAAGEADAVAEEDSSPPPSGYRISPPTPDPGTTAAGALGPSSRATVQAVAPLVMSMAVTSCRPTTMASSPSITGAGRPATCVESPIPVFACQAAR